MIQSIEELPEDTLLECSFMLSIHSDDDLAEDAEPESKACQWLEAKLLSLFKGVKVYRDSTSGLYLVPHSNQSVAGKFCRYTVPVQKRRLDEMRRILIDLCDAFDQESIYLSIAGHVEFVALAR